MSAVVASQAGLWSAIEPLLPKVSRPARYIGCEQNIIRKEPTAATVRWLALFPDTYEVGLPNLGLQILYDMLNDQPDVQCERAYLPWPDMAEQMRANSIPLFSVDRHDSALEFDVWGVTFPSELLFTNLLEALDLAGLSLRSGDRGETDPLIIAGGHGVMNPEPIAPFIDAAVIGDGEDAVLDIVHVLSEWKSTGRAASKVELLRELVAIEGVYVPRFYDVDYNADSTIASITPNDPAAPERVEKRTIADLDAMPYPRKPLVPVTEVVHDRLNVEIFRGCTRGCRFCQAGMITRPVRERSPESVKQMIDDGLECSGYEDVSLLSLSSADYSGIDEIVADVTDGADRVSISLPSLRVDAFTVGIAEQISRVRKTGLTFAPEAGTWRMRSVINKLITDDDLFAAVEGAFSAGWKRVKLYFMIGLPTEVDDDVRGIGELSKQVVEVGKRHQPGASCTVSVGGFVPKAHTPFQWCGQDERSELKRKIRLLREETRRSRAKLRWRDPDATTAEGIVSRGDRRIADVIEEVWRVGGVFQEWRERFSLDLWMDALAANGLDLGFYVHRHRSEDEVFPWDHISAGLHRDFLWDEWQAALDHAELEDCRWTPCYDCGVCTDHGLEHLVGVTLPPAGSSQGTGQALPRPTRGHPGNTPATPRQRPDGSTTRRDDAQMVFG